MITPFRPGLTDSRLDRADQLRIDDDKMAEVRSSLRARILKLADLDPDIDPEGALSWGSMADCPAEAELLFSAWTATTHASRR